MLIKVSFVTALLPVWRNGCKELRENTPRVFTHLLRGLGQAEYE
jgi:hypothetical protein